MKKTFVKIILAGSLVSAPVSAVSLPSLPSLCDVRATLTNKDFYIGSVTSALVLTALCFGAKAIKNSVKKSPASKIGDSANAAAGAAANAVNKTAVDAAAAEAAALQAVADVTSSSN